MPASPGSYSDEFCICRLIQHEAVHGSRNIPIWLCILDALLNWPAQPSDYISDWDIRHMLSRLAQRVLQFLDCISGHIPPRKGSPFLGC